MTWRNDSNYCEGMIFDVFIYQLLKQNHFSFVFYEKAWLAFAIIQHSYLI